MNTDIKEILSYLTEIDEISEAYKKITFECVRKEEIIEVTILDAGLDVSHGRYMCYAESESGKKASGNPTDSIKRALSILHWGDLDE